MFLADFCSQRFRYSACAICKIVKITFNVINLLKLVLFKFRDELCPRKDLANSSLALQRYSFLIKVTKLLLKLLILHNAFILAQKPKTFLFYCTWTLPQPIKLSLADFNSIFHTLLNLIFQECLHILPAIVILFTCLVGQRDANHKILKVVFIQISYCTVGIIKLQW